MNNKYLSDVLSAKELLAVSNNRVCVLAGVGAGKNYFITNHLHGYGNIFFVSSRRATINEMLLNEICKEKVDWNKFSDEILPTTNYGVELLVKNTRFSTYGIKNFIEHFDIVVIDEFHSIKADSTFADSAFHLYTFLNYISHNYPNIKIIVMTGTDEPIKDILDRDKYVIIDKRHECINVLPKNMEVISHSDAVKIIESLPLDQKTIYYTNSTKHSIYGKTSLFRKLVAGCYKENEIAIAVAKEKAEEIAKKSDCPIGNIVELSEDTKEYITSKHSLPPQKRLLITTSTLKEGINITAKDIKIAFCESHILSDIQQFAGRVRNGLDKLYIINDGFQFTITHKQQQANYLDIIFSNKILENLNNFFNLYILNENSVIYHNLLGMYTVEDLPLYNLFLSEDLSIYNFSTAAKTFIDMIESKHSYIRFNHLLAKFELFITAYQEQRRIHEYFAAGWESKIRTFCNENGIGYINNTGSKIIDTSAISQGIDRFCGRKLFETERDKLLSFISTSFGLESKRPNITTCNKLFQKHNLPYEIKNSNTQGKRYLEVLRISTSC